MRILSELYPHWFVTNNISAASASASHLFLSLSRLNAPAVINCCDDERPTAERERELMLLTQELTHGAIFRRNELPVCFDQQTEKSDFMWRTQYIGQRTSVLTEDDI